MRELVNAKIARRSFPLRLANALFDRKRAAIEDEIGRLRELIARLDAMRREMNANFG